MGADTAGALFLIGSQLERPTLLSDIDIAILGTEMFSFEQMISLQDKISQCLETYEVDLRGTNPDFAFKTLSGGKKLLINNELVLADFTAYTCDRVFDYRLHLMECIN